jgi:serine/threonine protein kinase
MSGWASFCVEFGISSELSTNNQLDDQSLDLARETGILRLNKIGGGAFGQVFRGFDLKVKQEIAIKVIDLDETKDDILFVRREIAALSEGSNCPYLVEYKGTRVVGTQLWILMEYMKGGTIAEKVKIKPLDEKQTAIAVKQVLKGLLYLHSENKIHRDIVS